MRTDADGRYQLPVRPDMSVFVVKPSGWRTPTNNSFVPQFAYQHKPDCVLYLGDVMGDDLGLLPRLLEVGGALETPQYLVHGNHDFDFDAPTDADSSDSWRRLFGPNYYAFEIGQATFVVLDNVVFPCGALEAATGRESIERLGFEVRPERPPAHWRREPWAL